VEITEVRIKLINNPDDRLRGFCSVTIDDSFVVRDLKIIEGNNGPFVAMPSRKLTSNCHKCRSKNHLRANYCNLCGTKLRQDQIEHDSGGRAKLYADVAHPVNAKCRELIQNRVVQELNREQKLAAQPGYASRYDDDYFDDDLGSLDVADAADQALPKPSEPDKSEEKQPVDASQAGASSPMSADACQSTTPIIRFDPPEKSPHKTHKPDDDLSESPNSPDEGFGKGVFE